MINPILNILHLNRREDRMQQLIRQMQWNKVTYTMWEGYDEPDNVKQAISKGHKKIVQFAKDNNFSFVNIAEDDIIFTNKDSYKYFNSQVPEDYDIFCGVIYHGQVDDNHRILNGMSATMTLYRLHQRFYDFFLSQPDNVHLDRNLGQYAYVAKYIVCHPQVCFQSGGMSDQLKRVMYYDPYMDGKDFYGHEGQTYKNGEWQTQ